MMGDHGAHPRHVADRGLRADQVKARPEQQRATITMTAFAARLRYMRSMKASMIAIIVAVDIMVMKIRVQLQNTWSIE